MKVSIIPFIINKIKSGLGIVQDTDTADQAIAKGKYVFWKGNLKKASSAIAQNDALSSSNLSDVSGGALNELNGHIVRNETWIQHSALANYSQGIGLPSSWRALYVLISNSGSSVPEYYTFTVYSWSPVVRFISGYGGDGFCYCTFVIENNTLVIGGHKYKGSDYTPKVAVYYM